MGAKRPTVIQMEFEDRLDVPYGPTIAYLLQQFGPLDAKSVAAVFGREFPSVGLPHAKWSTLLSQAAAQGFARRVGRGIYAAA